VTLNLAPVADVNVDPLNPVIGLRSFSADPLVAARHVAESVRGLQRMGVSACVKHFPGHGATRADSHHELAILDRPREALQKVELEPFRAAISAGAHAVMTGHLLVPALDASAMATVSAAITTRLLREELGFTGSVVTDALEMKAVSASIGMVAGFVRALEAGADAIETGAMDYPELLVDIPAAVQEAILSGRLDEDRLVDAANRARRLAVLGDAGAAADSVVAAAAAARCIEVIGDLPVLHRPLVVECRTPGGMASGELPWSLAHPLAALVDGTDGFAADANVVAETVMNAAAGRSLVMLIRDPGRLPWQRSLVDAARRRGDCVLVDAGWPAQLPPGIPIIRTRGIAPGLLSAAARVLAAGHGTPLENKQEMNAA
jgi:beta-N-acetylhexosaminidase